MVTSLFSKITEFSLNQQVAGKGLTDGQNQFDITFNIYLKINGR